jgi:hypothetical protein
MEGSLTGRMEDDPDLADLSPDQRRGLLFKMQVFQTGLTAMTATEQLPETITESELVGILERAAEDFIAAETRRIKE